MKIDIRTININNSFEVEAYVKWENDLEFYHLIAPMRSKDSKVVLVTVEGTVKFFQENPSRLKDTYIVWDDTKPIGQITIHTDPPHLFKKYKNTCWIGLTIGEKEYWGTGAALRAMRQLEKLGYKTIGMISFGVILEWKNF